MKQVVVAGILVIFSFFIGVYLYPWMPEKMDSHWGAGGKAEATSGKFSTLFAIPIISLIMLLFLYFIPRFDPMEKNIRKFQKHYGWMIFFIVAFLFYIYLAVVAWNLGLRFNFASVLIPGFAVLFLFIGFFLEKTEQNWFAGIRTPWTLSSKNVWKKTHMLGAKLFKVSALVSLFGLVFRNGGIWFVIVPVLCCAVYLVGYSYWEFRKERANKSKNKFR